MLEWECMSMLNARIKPRGGAVEGREVLVCVLIICFELFFCKSSKHHCLLAAYGLLVISQNSR